MSEVLKISDDHFIEYKFDLIKSLFGLYYDQLLDEEISFEKSISLLLLDGCWSQMRMRPGSQTPLQRNPLTSS